MVSFSLNDYFGLIPLCYRRRYSTQVNSKLDSKVDSMKFYRVPLEKSQSEDKSGPPPGLLSWGATDWSSTTFQSLHAYMSLSGGGALSTRQTIISLPTAFMRLLYRQIRQSSHHWRRSTFKTAYAIPCSNAEAEQRGKL